jgi:hypothetical protein
MQRNKRFSIITLRAIVIDVFYLTKSKNIGLILNAAIDTK